jgi:hypothetical protein
LALRLPERKHMELPSLSIEDRPHHREFATAVLLPSVEQRLRNQRDVYESHKLRDEAQELEWEIERATVERAILNNALHNNNLRWMLAGQKRYGGTDLMVTYGFSTSYVEAVDDDADEEKVS